MVNITNGIMIFTVNKNTPANPNKENTMDIIRSDCFLDDCQIIPAKKERMIAP